MKLGAGAAQSNPISGDPPRLLRSSDIPNIPGNVIGENREPDCEEIKPQLPRRSPRLSARSGILKCNEASLGRAGRNCREKNVVGETGSENRFGKQGFKRARLSPPPAGVSMRVVYSVAEKQVMDGNRWQHFLPVDILISISDLLSLPDLIRFRSVCRSWRSAPSSRSSITEFFKGQPWLILHGFEKNRSSEYILLQLSSKLQCILKLPALNGAVILVSKSGWLLCHRGNHYFFFNPFTLKKIDLPDHPQPSKPSTIQVATFTAPPTFEGCVTFVIKSHKSSELEFSWWRPTDKKWTFDSIKIGANLPSLTERSAFAACCSCREYGSCKCKHCHMVVILQLKTWMTYNFVKKEFLSGRGLHSYKRCWWSDLVDRRLNNLLSNFVENDAVVSFSSFNSARRGGLNLTPFDYRAENCGVSLGKAASVKAVWIEPTFPWH
ncbi:hypothetical protein KSP39_PZI007358 [Platanthera zijinensis]|uniref:F-box domain-containing protein n=1 Tax=Platanthera zijinensis TaxID=2320716 RepID=A0AAP0G9Y5_9ASPA